MMTEEKQINDFFTGLVSEINDINKGIKFCESHRNTNLSEINVISTAIIEIFSEINDYLEYYEEEIEKGLGCRTSDEKDKIYNEVIKFFVDGVNSGRYNKGYEKRIVFISEFIKKWLIFDKKKI